MFVVESVEFDMVSLTVWANQYDSGVYKRPVFDTRCGKTPKTTVLVPAIWVLHLGAGVP